MHWLPKASDESQWKHNGNNVCEEVFYRCSIEPRKDYRCGEIVMELVVTSVELRMMQDTVDVTCQDFACYVTIYKVPQCIFRRGQCGQYNEHRTKVREVPKSDLKCNIA